MYRFSILWQTTMKGKPNEFKNSNIWQNYYIIYILDINECESNLCENSATCVDEVDGYSCICVDGYAGTYCRNGSYPVNWFLVNTTSY